MLAADLRDVLADSMLTVKQKTGTSLRDDMSIGARKNIPNLQLSDVMGKKMNAV
jgi:hypothetical protein